MSNRWPPDEHFHHLQNNYMLRNFNECMAWCVERMGPAAFALKYDAKSGGLFQDPLNPDGVWYITGGASIAFKHMSDLLLFKLTFG